MKTNAKMMYSCLLGLLSAGTAMAKSPEGYTDTPMLPHAPWRVHDLNRPAPPVVTPGKESHEPPSDAIVLFAGKHLDAWATAKDGSPAKWTVENGYMEVAKKAGMIRTKQGFGSCQLHIEWMAPDLPDKNSQHKGNSGVFLMGNYEIQVLNCFENKTYSDGMAGSIYAQYPPLVNACRKPLEWQSYDILFEAPEFKDGKVVKKAYVTVLHNGVVVQNHTELIGRATHKKVATYAPHADKLPLSLQDHGDPVRFRNIWIREL